MRLIMVLFLLVIGASAESRIALLIGNGAYSEKILNNPVNDVDLLAKKLKELNFNVTKRKNQTMGEMNALLRNFYKKIDGDTIAIIYFSGHGVHSTLDDKNYLIPIGAFETLINEADLNNKAISDGSLLASTNGAKFSILLLDACRSNDFAKVKGDKGLGQPKSILPNDYVISYATEVGKTAKDGDTNSPYALALAQYLTSSYSIGDIFTQVRAKVSRGSGGRQKPYYDPHFENILYLNQGRGGREGGDDGGNIPSFPTPQMLHIKAGSYTMGSNKGDADEKPRHQVNINYDFEIGKYEVTIKEYKACVADGGCKQPEWLEKGSSYNIHTGSGYYYKKMCLKDNCPAIGVSWHNAKAYTKWISQKTGKSYRLPTEAEWEYVARAGTQTKWSFGDNESSLKKYAWYSKNSSSKTHQVGTKKANQWGVHDMHGNVWEWCEDWYLDSYNSTPSNGSANHSQKENDKVLRGGSWDFNATDARSAIRFRFNPTFRGDSIGFRLQRTLP